MAAPSGCLCCDVLYEGELGRDGLPQGMGTFRSRSLEFEYTGSFDQGRRHGLGKASFLGGAVILQAVFRRGEVRSGCELMRLTLLSRAAPSPALTEQCRAKTISDLLAITRPQTYECPADQMPLLTRGAKVSGRITDHRSNVMYEGELSEGCRSGAGHCIDLRDGSRLLVSSNWSEMITEGSGSNHYWSHVKTSQGIYSGNFRNRKMEGYGTYRGPEGLSYEGCWHGNKPHGFGKMSFPGGICYTGCFDKGQRHGFGVFSKHGAEIPSARGDWFRDKLCPNSSRARHALSLLRSITVDLPDFPKSPIFEDAGPVIGRCSFENVFKNLELMKLVGELINSVLLRIRAHESHCRQFAALLEPPALRCVTHPLNQGFCTEFTLLAVEGLEPSADRTYHLTMCVGDSAPIKSTEKSCHTGGTATWNEKLTLPSVFDADERVYIQLLATEHSEVRVVGGGFISLSVGAMSCMLIGRDRVSGYRGPVALVKFQGLNVIDYREISKEICFTL